MSISNTDLERTKKKKKDSLAEWVAIRRDRTNHVIRLTLEEQKAA